jgi:hypothetical protein
MIFIKVDIQIFRNPIVPYHSYCSSDSRHLRLLGHRVFEETYWNWNWNILKSNYSMTQLSKYLHSHFVTLTGSLSNLLFGATVRGPLHIHALVRYFIFIDIGSFWDSRHLRLLGHRVFEETYWNWNWNILKSNYSMTHLLIFWFHTCNDFHWYRFILIIWCPQWAWRTTVIYRNGGAA